MTSMPGSGAPWVCALSPGKLLIQTPQKLHVRMPCQLTTIARLFTHAIRALVSETPLRVTYIGRYRASHLKGRHRCSGTSAIEVSCHRFLAHGGGRARSMLGPYIGYLPQDIELFSDTVAANISRFQIGDDMAVIHAAQMAGVHEMILRLPNGYDTQVGEGGAILSGGFRQRIALARAVFGNPSLVVLDEPSSNLDLEGDEALTECMISLKKRRTTVVIISHRPAAIMSPTSSSFIRDGMVELFGPRAEVVGRLTRAVATQAIPKSIAS